MHESGLVADLVAHAEAMATDPSLITALRFRIGAMAAVTPEGLRHGAAELAAARWGHRPTIEIEQSSDVHDAGALTVTLTAMRVEG